MEKKKIKISKKVITPLLKRDLKQINGGAVTTTYYSCTGWTCSLCTGSGGTFTGNCCMPQTSSCD